MNCTRTGCTGTLRDQLSGDGAHQVITATRDRAAEMAEEDALSFLAVSLLRISLECRGWCSNCVLNAQGDVNGSITVAEQPKPGVPGKLLLLRRAK